MSEESGKRIITINGVKMELDERSGTVTAVETLRVGDSVKVLTKDYSGYAVNAGTIIGFEPFQKLPTICVAYIDRVGSALKFLYFNEESKDVEVIKATTDDFLAVDRETVERAMSREITKAETALSAAREKLAYFKQNFKAYWREAVIDATEEAK